MENNIIYQEFLLNLDCAHEACVKLLKENEILDKEQLIKEIERLMIEDIRKQIKV